MFQLSTRSGVFAFTAWIDQRRYRTTNRGIQRLRLIVTLLPTHTFRESVMYYFLVVKGYNSEGSCLPGAARLDAGNLTRQTHRCKPFVRNYNATARFVLTGVFNS